MPLLQRLIERPTIAPTQSFPHSHYHVYKTRIAYVTDHCSIKALNSTRIIQPASK
jgi:hypothetical protein